jgi:type 1 glutamine amidotransferase
MASLKEIVAMVAAFCALVSPVHAADQPSSGVRPLKALLLASGGYHDYAQLAPLLDTKLSQLVNVKFDVDMDESLSRLKNKDFARSYDVIVYDVCHVNTDSAILENAIRATRNGKPAVFIHCAVPAFRQSPLLHEWENFAGERSKTHTYMGAFGAQKVYVNHPVTMQWPNDWTTSYDELYDTNELIAGSLPLLVTASPKNGSIHTVAWIQTFGKGRVFGTALGHDMRTSATPAYLQLLANGLLWACDKLGEDGNPKPGYAAAK